VQRPYIDAAVELVREYYPNAVVNDKRVRYTPMSVARPVPWATALYDSLPPRLRQPVFRALARLLHPDTGGDKKVMQELNDNWGKR
jgi:hypothetical protein